MIRPILNDRVPSDYRDFSLEQVWISAEKGREGWDDRRSSEWGNRALIVP